MAASSILEEKRVDIEPTLGRNKRKLSCVNKAAVRLVCLSILFFSFCQLRDRLAMPKPFMTLDEHWLREGTPAAARAYDLVVRRIR
jgi:hypothetical protein